MSWSEMLSQGILIGGRMTLAVLSAVSVSGTVVDIERGEVVNALDTEEDCTFTW